jgi:hypothetical protein
MTSATPCSIDIDGVPVTLTPGTTQTIPFASFTAPGHTYELKISTTNRFVAVSCSCPRFTHRFHCKHQEVALDIVAVELHGAPLPWGQLQVLLPGVERFVPTVVADADLFDVA